MRFDFKMNVKSVKIFSFVMRAKDCNGNGNYNLDKESVVLLAERTKVNFKKIF